MTNPDRLAQTAHVLSAHGLSLAEHYLMCSAGYRVTLPFEAFVSHAFAVSAGDPRGHRPRPELVVALRRLLTRGLMLRLTAAALRADARRRTASTVPEVVDTGYEAGHVDFTSKGYAVHREVIRAIHGDAFLVRSDTGCNLDLTAGRFDVYAVTVDECRRLMDEIEAGRDAYTGAEGTRFVGRDEPAAIAAWRPNRFLVREAGYRGVLRFIGGGEPGLRSGQP